jgi:hypothetical protein
LKDVLDLQDSEEIKELLARLNIHDGTFMNLRRGFRRYPAAALYRTSLSSERS